ncbi:MAG: hypothetical protein J3K34DRAFT_42523 [Monoraphidium minutum]|nr:MAG: hypothetical protein J3K34DRAFT_42523 [Monoraphidium minutum]
MAPGMPILSLCSVIIAAVAVRAAQSPVSSYISCLGADTGKLEHTVYNDFVAGKPVRLLLREAWWSARPGRVPLTVVTGLTSSRLDQLGAQCASWRGPLSAAVYIVVKGDGAGKVSAQGEAALVAAAADVAAFHQK